MNEPRAKVFDRRSAAQKAVDFFHGKKGEMGKKEQKAEAAKQAGKGKFGQGKPPLSVVRGKPCSGPLPALTGGGA